MQAFPSLDNVSKGHFLSPKHYFSPKVLREHKITSLKLQADSFNLNYAHSSGEGEQNLTESSNGIYIPNSTTKELYSSHPNYFLVYIGSRAPSPLRSLHLL